MACAACNCVRPDASPGAGAHLAAQATARCRTAGADVLINGDIDLAQALGTGVHLRAAQLVQLSERPLPAEARWQRRATTRDELHAAQALGCDFVVLGAIKPTLTHPGRRDVGLAMAWRHCARTVSLPIYAIGGLTPDDVVEARRHGAQGIAAIRGLWPA